jgi:hypothetical protein
VIVGLAPANVNPLPARVTAPVVLLNVSELSSNGPATSFVPV